MKIRIGISGWTYAPWRGRFYPAGLPHREELSHAAGLFSSIEVNGTHYSLQTPESFRRWKAATPPEFVFSVKGPRYITHLRRLRDVGIPLANFFASGVLALEEKLGPVLWQFPPCFTFDEELLAAFFAQLPRDTWAAAALARRHDGHLRARAWLRPGRRRRIRYGVGIRHESFLGPKFFELLRRHRMAFVFADSAGKWPYVEDVTSDFLYLRLHGAEKLYESGYTDAALDEWARRLRSWVSRKRAGGPLGAPKLRPRQVREAFVYFDNDIKVMAPGDALRLAKRLDVVWAPP